MCQQLWRRSADRRRVSSGLGRRHVVLDIEVSLRTGRQFRRERQSHLRRRREPTKRKPARWDHRAGSSLDVTVLCREPPRPDTAARFSTLTSAGSRRPCRKEPHRRARSHPTDVPLARTRWHRAQCRPCLPRPRWNTPSNSSMVTT